MPICKTCKGAGWVIVGFDEIVTIPNKEPCPDCKAKEEQVPDIMDFVEPAEYLAKQEEHSEAHRKVNKAYDNLYNDIKSRDYSKTPAKEHGAEMDIIHGSHRKEIREAEINLDKIHLKGRIMKENKTSSIPTVKICVEVQQNGIIRDLQTGRLIGRLCRDDIVSYEYVCKLAEQYKTKPPEQEKHNDNNRK